MPKTRVCQAPASETPKCLWPCFHQGFRWPCGLDITTFGLALCLEIQSFFAITFRATSRSCALCWLCCSESGSPSGQPLAPAHCAGFVAQSLAVLRLPESLRANTRVRPGYEV